MKMEYTTPQIKTECNLSTYNLNLSSIPENILLDKRFKDRFNDLLSKDFEFIGELIDLIIAIDKFIYFKSKRIIEFFENNTNCKCHEGYNCAICLNCKHNKIVMGGLNYCLLLEVCINHNKSEA